MERQLRFPNPRAKLSHHWIIATPVEGERPKFAQLYIYDTANEVSKSLKTVSRASSDNLNEDIVAGLIEMMNSNNKLAKLFRTARDRYVNGDADQFSIRLVGQKRRGRQYDLPTGDEVASLIIGDLSLTNGHRDVIVEKQSSQLQRISESHPSFMAMQYPLLFLFGEDGFHKDIQYNSEVHSSQGLSIIRGGRLLHQYVVDAYTAVEQDVRNSQKTLRADIYNNVCDAVARGDTDPKQLGKRIILPSSFTGSPRYMLENYQDAMALCRWYGNPQLFITITANPKWEEIKEHIQMYGDDMSNDRPDLQCRLFKIKLDHLLKDIREGHFFQKSLAVVYTIEFQKRGLPHAHILVWLDGRAGEPTTEEVDAVITAEIPDKNTDLEGYKLVEQFMMHGPCGMDRPNSPCMEKVLSASQDKPTLICTKKFPIPYAEQTTVDASGYVRYKRRNDPTRFVIKNGGVMDNSYVVPHNLCLLKKYRAHINVEWCTRSKAIKYLFKYITKGVDKATMIIEKANSVGDVSTQNAATRTKRDEIKKYVDCRYLSAHEAKWRIFAFDIHYSFPAVQRLSIHLENQRNVLYNDSDELERVLDSDGVRKTMFTEWMEADKRSTVARELTYIQFPTKFVYNASKKVWTNRKQGFCICRIVNIHPTSVDIYYLKMLLMIVKGPTTFQEIRTFNNIVYQTFKEACYKRGLLDGNSEWRQAIDELQTS